jgi:anti-anti-sigma factor
VAYVTTSSPRIAVLSYPQPDTTVCTVTGKIDTDTTPALWTVLAQAVRDDNPHLVIDLSAVTFLDSHGLHALFVARNHHDLRGGGLLTAVIDKRTAVISALYIVALEVTFDLHTTLTDALHACATR